MITFYIKPTCAYSKKVIKAVEALNVPAEMKDIADVAIADELVALGGKHQVPFMVDSERGVSMYDSDDIVRYLCQHFGGNEDEFTEEVEHTCGME